MNIVIMGAHPDDPEGGCGGFALKAVKAGHKVSCLYMTSGNRYGNAADGQTVAETREMEARRAAGVIGAEPNFFRCGDKEVTFDTELLARVTRFIEDSKADLVLAHWPADLHPDHQAVGVLATQAVRSLPNVVLGYY
ncbi:MAG TPA: PIG-L family deacetylase, partial [Armatimonadota bacterium]